MKLINQLIEEVHRARIILQRERREEVKLAIYINHLTWHELCRELYHAAQYRSDICLAGIGHPHGTKEHILGYPCYEVYRGQELIPWNIVEIFIPKDIPVPRKLSEKTRIPPHRLRGAE